MRRALAIALGLAFGACGGGGSSGTGPSATASPTPSPGTSPPASASSDPIFDQGRLHEVRISIDPSDWAALQENFRANDYYAADITLDTTTIRQAGIRSRGSGSRSEVKPALKLDFNKYIPTQE